MLRQVFWRPDVVWVVEPPLFCAPQGWLVAKLSGAKAWLHVQDFEVDAAFDMGLLRSPLARRFALWGQRVLMSRFDCVSSISFRMQQRLLDKGGRQSVFSTFQIGWILMRLAISLRVYFALS